MGFLFKFVFIFASGLSATQLQGHYLIFKSSCVEIKKKLSSSSCLSSKGPNSCKLNIRCISPLLSSLVKTKYIYPGPNCFSTSLIGAGIYNSIRGVSSLEFQQVLNHSCLKVNNPKLGDIGVYSNPGFGPIHAYTYINKYIAFEKPGVDYFGKTAVRFNLRSHIDYTHKASPACRQHGDATCHSTKTYYRCVRVYLEPNFKNLLVKIDTLIERMLTDGVKNPKEIEELKFMTSQLTLISASPLEKSIVKSLELQAKFIE